MNRCKRNLSSETISAFAETILTYMTVSGIIMLKIDTPLCHRIFVYTKCTQAETNLKVDLEIAVLVRCRNLEGELRYRNPSILLDHSFWFLVVCTKPAWLSRV